MDKREMILREAARLFAEKGYYGLSLSELLKRCEIPKGSFYHYFPDGKIQLIQEVLEYSYRKMADGIMTNSLVRDTALASFEYMCDRLAAGYRQSKYYPSMLLSMIAIESVYLDENVNATCARIYADWQKLYADFLMRHGYTQEESVTKGQAIFAMVHGSLISSWIKNDPSDLLMVKQALRAILVDK
ncbi:MAG: TetR/AcrR family transcriptional regulator [Clostridia bacterium]|nr:TetR/AcrR family transcriptional regulator [Clostridia bacterium]